MVRSDCHPPFAKIVRRMGHPLQGGASEIKTLCSELVQDAGFGDLAHFFEGDAAVGDTE